MNFEEDYMEPNELPNELASIRHINTYKVPPHFFAELADEIIGQIHLPLAATVPFQAPTAEYFDGLATSILSKIDNQSATLLQNEVQKELEETEPLLARIPKVNVYRVPDNYFDTFTVSVTINKPAIVRKLNRRASWITYAAAAVIIGIIAIGILFLINNNRALQNDTNSYAKALSRVSDRELVNYLETIPSDADFIPVSIEGGSTVTDSESLLKSWLNNVSDNEIQNYLKENSEGDEKDIKGI